MMKVLLSSVCISLGLAAASASGQSITSPYRFVEESQSGGGFGGYMYPARGSVGIGPQSGPVGGVRYTIRLSGPFTVEADAGYFSSTRAVLDTIVVDSARQRVGTADLGLLLVNGSLRFNLTGPRTWHRVQPYAVFGAGVAVDMSGASAADEDLPADVRFDFGTSFAGQLGGGLELFPANRLTLRLDARSVLWKITTPVPFLRGELAQQTPPDEWLQNGYFTVGLTFHF